MIFDAEIAGDATETINCRVYDKARREWWTGIGWGTAEQALLTPLAYVGGGIFGGSVQYPAAGVTVQYLNGEGGIIGSDPTDDPAGASMILPLVTSRPATLSLVNSVTIGMTQRNSYRLPFDLGRDCTGWSVYFGAKAKYSQPTYDIEPREGVFTDEVAGVGYVDLTVEDMDLAGVFHGELQLRQGDQRNTPETYTLNIKPTVFAEDAP